MRTHGKQIRPRGYKTDFVLNSTEHEILTAHKSNKCLKIQTIHAFNLTNVVFIMLIYDKMPIIVDILSFMSMINFMVEWSMNLFINPGPVLGIARKRHRIQSNTVTQTSTRTLIKDLFLGGSIVILK